MCWILSLKLETLLEGGVHSGLVVLLVVTAVPARQSDAIQWQLDIRIFKVALERDYGRHRQVLGPGMATKSMALARGDPWPGNRDRRAVNFGPVRCTCRSTRCIRPSQMWTQLRCGVRHPMRANIAGMKGEGVCAKSVASGRWGRSPEPWTWCGVGSNMLGEPR